ncbi:MAG TPA: VOC family protein [Salinimicrobium sp.]|nr:VOC family protein [Salinimicrobium sp.]
MRIDCLKIYTEKLPAQKRFYSEVLRLPVKQTSEEEIEIQIGFSVLKIRQKKGATPYHIAFHIPAQQEMKALQWLKQRVLILKNAEEEIVDFPAWKAKSIYFYDADKNVMEFISRRHFFPSQSEEFSGKSLVGIAEIGLATNNVKNVFDFLNQKTGLEKFTGDYERFCATGDEEGLFIVIDKNQKDWIPMNDKAFASEFITDIVHRNKKYPLIFEEDELKERK